MVRSLLRAARRRLLQLNVIACNAFLGACQNAWQWQRQRGEPCLPGERARRPLHGARRSLAALAAMAESCDATWTPMQSIAQRASCTESASGKPPHRNSCWACQLQLQCSKNLATNGIQLRGCVGHSCGHGLWRCFGMAACHRHGIPVHNSRLPAAGLVAVQAFGTVRRGALSLGKGLRCKID